MGRHDSENLPDITSQKNSVPAIYGNVDFSIDPERFTESVEDTSALSGQFTSKRAELLANRPMVDLIKTYTMMGDHYADAYAALIPKYGFSKLVETLEKACDNGVDSVVDAPQELIDLLKELERKPAWVDMSLIEEGARRQRNTYAHLFPFTVRGA